MMSKGRWSGFDGSRRAEIAAAAVLTAVGLVGFVVVPNFVSGWAFQMPGTTDAALAPTFFPRLAMALIVVAGLGVILSAPQRAERLPLVDMSRSEWLRFACVVAAILAFFLGLRVVGFVPASIVFIAAISVMLGYRRPIVVAAASILAPVLIVLAFRYGLKVLLPSGWAGTLF
jgi:uncharacterized Tic20 family protein